MDNIPKIGITMGDAAGIGPDIIVDAWRKISQRVPCQPLVYGHPEILRRAAQLRLAPTGQTLEIRTIHALRELDSMTDLPSPGAIPCLFCCNDNVKDVPPGQIDARAGEAAFQAINAAIDDAMEHHLDAVVTAPIHKEALNLAGHHYPGHTEIFASRCGKDDFAMMLYLGADEPSETASHRGSLAPGGLAVVHVTLHTAMRTIFDLITVDSVLAKARLADHFMQKIMAQNSLGSTPPKPRIGVCSLNPHAGENGLFGREEIEVIRPAIEKAQREGLNIQGPFPADTIMIDAKNGHYDAVVAMFHDQGHIALKLLDMQRAVNVTLGLPMIRTSVAHGTAFDRAWQGTAESGSLFEAVRVAAKLALNRT